MYDNFMLGQLKGIANAVVDFDTDVIKIALLTDQYEPDQTIDDFFSDVSMFETTGTNYTPGGNTLTTPTISLVNNIVIFNADDTTWTVSAAGFNNARYGVIYKSTGTAATARLIAFIDFINNVSNKITSLVIHWSDSGIISWAPNIVYAAPINPNTRARPIVANGTLKTDTGTLLRGGTMDLRTSTTPVSSNNATWVNWRAAGLNVCRYDVKTVLNGRTPAAQIPYIDAAVSRAEANRMYIMIDQSIQPGSYDKAALTDFWTQVAPRYKDRPCVIYETTNEPVGGGPFFGAAANWTNAIIQDFHDIYVLMRNAAPDTPIILFSTANFSPSAAAWHTVVQSFEAKGAAVDWTKTVFGYHHYLGTYAAGAPDGFGALNQFKAWYPIIMTECNDFIGDAPSNDIRNKTAVWLEYEQNGISWVNLDGKAGTINTQITNEILPFLASNGFPVPIE
jgi:hypothetical protein